MQRVNIYAKAEDDEEPGPRVWTGTLDELGGVPELNTMIATPGMGHALLMVFSVRRFLGADPFIDIYTTDLGSDE